MTDSKPIVITVLSLTSSGFRVTVATGHPKTAYKPIDKPTWRDTINQIQYHVDCLMHDYEGQDILIKHAIERARK